MCGIFGFYGDYDLKKLISYSKLQNHRGPDNYNYYFKDYLFLAHNRLSIIDLSENANQPFEYNNRYKIVFNGEIYNYLELRKILSGYGYSFRTNSDTEVILAAYDKWKEECLLKFNGMWSFCIYDKIDNKFFLAKDRLGKKPLFYIHDKNFLAFSSEMKAIVPLLPEVKINHKLINNKNFYFNYETNNNSLVQEIKKILPGHYLTYQNNNIFIKKWYQIYDNIDGSIINKSYSEKIEIFNELFNDSCNLRLRSDVDVATCLSGGLDSSMVTAKINLIKNSKFKNKVYCNYDSDQTFNEVSKAKTVSEFLNVNLETVKTNVTDALNNFSKYLYQYEEIYISNPIPFMQTYKAISKAGFKVTLDGHGADELFCGYPFDALHSIKDNLSNPKQIKNIIKMYYNAYSKNIFLPNKLYFFIKWLLKESNILKNIINKQKFDSLNSRLFESTFYTILPTLLRNYDRYSMSSGVEIRMPFLDYRIVEFAFSISSLDKIKNNRTKSILRDSLTDNIDLPSSTINENSKIGWNSSFHIWANKEFKVPLQDLFNSTSFNNSDIIDKNKIKKIFKKNTEKPDYLYGEYLWKLLHPFFWEKAFLKKESIF